MVNDMVNVPNLVMTFRVRHGFLPWPAYRNRWFTELNSMVDLSMANC